MFEEERGTGSWRTFQYEQKRGNLYPTHGLGPVSQYMNLLRSEDNLIHSIYDHLRNFH